MLLLYALAMAQLVVFAATTYAVGHALGAKIQEIGVGAPPVLRVRRAVPSVRVGPLPSASVAMTTADGAPYTHLPVARRLAITLAPWLVVLAIAIACLGLEPALRSFARGLYQFVAVVDVTPLVAAMVELARTGPLELVVGIMAAKIAAMNLLPFGGLAGGAVIRDVLGWPRWFDTYVAISMIAFMLWTLARFGYAIVSLL